MIKAAPTAKARIGIAWQIGTEFGWGLYGYHIAKHMIAEQLAIPTLLEPAGHLDLDPIERSMMAGALAYQPIVSKKLAQQTSSSVPMRIPILHACGNNGDSAFADAGARARGHPNHALVFLESTNIDRSGRAAFSAFDRIVAGSSWNKQILLANGLDDTLISLQGVDRTLFHPAPSSGRFRNRFVIFSGGKLEYRKGQDVVLAAVGAFRQRHPETLLIAVWGNPWPDSPQVRLLSRSKYVDGLPPVNSDGHIDLSSWFGRYNLSHDDVYVLDRVPHSQMARLIREADVGLFPNRCEGGTNLAAMECMAAGIPTILSANTGHLDLISNGVCYPLRRQSPVPSPHRHFGTDGWGESDLDEIMECLETAWRNRDAAKEVGMAGARHMTGFTWSDRIGDLLTQLGLADMERSNDHEFFGAG